MNVVVNGLMTSYVKAGSGRRVIVMLHGWGDTAATFKTLALQLQKKYTVLVPDLPGFGGSQEPPKAWGVDDYANFVVAWLDKIGQKDIYAVVGHSNGGAIAVSLLGNKRLTAKKLVLLASSGIRDVYQMRKLVLRGGAKIVQLPLKILPQETQRRIKRRAYSAIGSDYMLFPELDLSFRKLISQDMQAVATRIKIPTLLIYGIKDKTTPVKYGQLFNDAITGSKLETVEAGHMLHHHQPDQIASLTEAFLGKR